MVKISIDVEDSKLLDSVGKSKLKDNLFYYVRLVLRDRDSRNLFFFLVLNFSFAIVELVYGVWTNSLGLISDAFHMFFDCTGLLAGLAASIVTKWKANQNYNYGYVRAEILGGFCNGLLLLFVAMFIFKESIERAIEPPEVKHERLFLVSVLGLLVNLVGIFVFQHGGVIGHGHSHGHSHDENNEGSHGHSHGESQIMKGVFLHILADTLGSCGVILSSILMYYFGWMIADPLCSMFIAVLICISVKDLIIDSGVILMQRKPRELDPVLPGILQRLTMIPGVFSVQEPRFWTLCTGQYVGNIKLEVSGGTDPRYIVSQAQSLLKSVGVSQLYVQLDYSTTT